MYKYLLYFLTFSFFGWCTEVVFHFLKCGRIINRGLAKGPICPIYGVGVCVASLLLGHVESVILLALLSMAILTVVELAVGCFCDRALGERLWDYRAEKGNIFGYVCPRFSVIWGVACAALLKLLPLIDRLFARLKTPVFYGLSFTLLTLVIVDVKTSILKRRGKITKA